MADQQTIENLTEKLATQARTFEARLSQFEATLENAGGCKRLPPQDTSPEQVSKVSGLLIVCRQGLLLAFK